MSDSFDIGRMGPSGLVVALCSLLLAGPLGAQDSGGSEEAAALAPIVASAVSGEAGIQLDGRVDESAWSGATAITEFTQQEPVEGGTPSQPTEIKVLFDEDYLYIGAILYDDPEGILAYQMKRDAPLGTDDRFMWILDTFLDGRTGYFFEINPAGLMGDGLIGGGGGGGGNPGGGGGGGGRPGGGGGGFGGGGPGGGGGGVNKAWDGIWEARTARRPDGWSAEIRIPFRTLNFDPDQSTWGINFQRTIRRHNEEILWRGFRRNQGIFKPINAGRLTGLGEISQGLGLEVTPYATSNWRNAPTVEDDFSSYDNSFPGDVGFDVGYSITPSLRAAVSVNTDFAEVEVDDRQVNLTRFPLRFPERRDFFLEGSQVFMFAPGGFSSPYYSRRIGLQDGGAVPVKYGARLGGQAGPYELGFIHVETGEAGGSPSESFSVGRVKQQLLDESYVGFIYTRRATSADSLGFTPVDRHTFGIDAEYSTSELFGDKNFDAGAFWVWNSNPVPDEERSLGDLTVRGFRINFPNDTWSGNVAYRQFGNAYDPAIGFVNRNDYSWYDQRISWRPRPAGIDWLRQLDFSANLRYLADLETGQVAERQWQFGFPGLNFESGDNIDFNVSNQYEYLDEAFEVSDGVTIEPGRYSYWEWSLRGGTAGRRRLSAFGNVGAGGFWNGDRIQSGVGLTFRPRSGVSIGTNYDWNKIDLPQGEFQTNLMRVSGGWDPTPRTSLIGNVQYEDVSDVVGLFLKAQWTPTPGNDLFLVYSHNWLNLYDDPLGRNYATLSRGASVKASYTYRF